MTLLPPDRHQILVVDDEPDVFAVTRLTLRAMRHRDRSVHLEPASSGAEAVAKMRAAPDTAVILMDVTMETPSAGLDACRAIRRELGNSMVRILLRTGQPGLAPERAAIEEHDIDGYLAKAELTSHRLYAAVRAALKAHHELMELERHRRMLRLVHECVLGMRPFDPLEASLRRILDTTGAMEPEALALLLLETREAAGGRRKIRLHRDPAGVTADPARLDRLEARLSPVAATPGAAACLPLEEGHLVRLELHRDLGHGWLYLDATTLDDSTIQALELLASHAGNALYATVAQTILRASAGSRLLDDITI